MNTKNIKQTLVIALAMMFALTIGSTVIFGQDKTDNQLINSPANEEGNALTGVWEAVAPVLNDCQSGEPFGPIVRILYMFNQGGTMTLEDTFEGEGPYRTTGAGIWKRTSGRNYAYFHKHYSFDPDKTFTGIVNVKSNITMQTFGRSPDSFTEKGTVEITDPNGNIVFTGCFATTAHRLRF